MIFNTYLNFNGNCEEAMNFYQDVFGGEFTSYMRFKEAPKDTFVAPDFAKDWIMHCTLNASGATIMASDYFNEQEPFTQGNNFAVSISCNDEDQAFAIFNGLAENGFIMMPLETAFWGGKFGMLRDKFGVNWMVSIEDYNS